MRHLNLAILWILWCVVHSGMISPSLTSYLKRRFGSGFRFYRLFYNLVAFFTLIPVVLYGRSINGDILFRWQGVGVMLQAVLLTVSLGLFYSGAQQYDMLQFLGLRSINTQTSCVAISEDCALNTEGVLGITRHPWYLAAIILIWTCRRSIDAAALTTNIILTVYLIVGTILEERKLIMEHGNEYRRYQENVSMLIPFKYFKSRFF